MLKCRTEQNELVARIRHFKSMRKRIMLTYLEFAEKLFIVSE